MALEKRASRRRRHETSNDVGDLARRDRAAVTGRLSATVLSRGLERGISAAAWPATS
jgi:hypothetical protein